MHYPQCSVNAMLKCNYWWTNAQHPFSNVFKWHVFLTMRLVHSSWGTCPQVVYVNMFMNTLCCFYHSKFLFWKLYFHFHIGGNISSSSCLDMEKDLAGIPSFSQIVVSWLYIFINSTVRKSPFYNFYTILVVFCTINSYNKCS